MRLYRNWPVICLIADARLKLCVALATDERVLEGLQRGFPELFTEGKLEHDGPWPLSVLRRVVEESCGPESNDDYSTAHRTLGTRFGFPFVEAWVLGGTVTEVPGDVMQLTGDEAELINAMWQRGEALFPKTTSRVTVGGTEYYLGWVGDVNALTQCYLYPCALVSIEQRSLSTIIDAFLTRSPTTPDQEVLERIGLPHVIAVGPNAPEAERAGKLVLSALEDHELREEWVHKGRFPRTLNACWVNDVKYYLVCEDDSNDYSWVVLVPASVVNENS